MKKLQKLLINFSKKLLIEDKKMLTSLYIKNLAVIKELQIDFEKGLTVLTGETGAGKSILIDAFFVILGLRVSKETIRKNEKSMYAEASFYFENPKNSEIIDSYVVDNTLVISREIFYDGRNVVKINGRTGNTAILRELAPYLISIHSQSDNQRIFDAEMHYKYLDIFGNATELFNEYSILYNEYNELKKQIAEAENSLDSDLEKIDYLKFVKKDIEDANIGENEEDELKKIKQTMKEAKQLADSSAIACGNLFENENSAYNLMGEAVDAMKNFDIFSEFHDRLLDLREEIAAISDSVLMQYKSITDEINEKYSDINEIENRLNEIYVIKSKYGGTVEGVFERLKQVDSELYNLEHREYIIEELLKKKSEIEENLSKISEKLSENRRKSAEKLSVSVVNELHELMMPNAKFTVNLQKNDEYTKYGKEKVEFLFSANAGMEVQPLCKIASGGEISRVNLAIKSILYDIDPACAFVFDEIDVGISGRAAQKTAEKMYGISSKNQVLCVTHLPQIASMADNHLLITKNEKEDQTVTEVSKIEGAERTEEIARIISGVSVTELTLKNADETLKLAEEYKTMKGK